jgi:hypothetical protein
MNKPQGPLASALIVLAFAVAGCSSQAPGGVITAGHRKASDNGFTPPPAATTEPPQPGAVSSNAQLTGNCVMGFMPTGQGAEFVAGPPQTENISGTAYYPVIRYQLSLTNDGTATADIDGWVVALYDSSGTELGSDQETASDEFLTSNQKFTWSEYAPNDTQGSSQNFGDDNSIPADGSAATCKLIQWTSGDN